MLKKRFVMTSSFTRAPRGSTRGAPFVRAEAEVLLLFLLEVLAGEILGRCLAVAHPGHSVVFLDE